MKEKKNHNQKQKKDATRSQDRKTSVLSYRLQCARAGNGLSHYVMYGDEKNSLV